MTERKLYFPGSEADDRIVVEEMLRNSQSGQWYDCREFVKRLVQLQAKNIPRDQWEDIVQDAMIRIGKSLPGFQYQCKLRTWLFGIIRSCIIDTHRKFTRAGQFMAPLSDPQDNIEREGDEFTANALATVEDECIARDELDKALRALQEYVSAHAKAERNKRILDMVILEGRSLEAAAKAVGCSAAVAGYVVRSAQRYVRDKLGYQR